MGHSDAFTPPRRPLAAGSFFLAAGPSFFRRQPNQDQVAALAQPPHRRRPSQLALFDGAAFEALRFKPVTPLIGLEANQDFVLGDIFLPAGTQVFLCSRPAMMDDRYFKNAKEFDPSRWSRRSEGSASRQAFTQFGGGPRVCPGRSLAIREIRMVLSMLCRNFSFELAGDPSNIREIFSFTMKPSSVPLHLSVLH